MPRPQFSLKTIVLVVGALLLVGLAVGAFLAVRDFEAEMGRIYEERRREYEERERRNRSTTAAEETPGREPPSATQD